MGDGYMNPEEARAEVVRLGRILLQSGLVSGTWGNVSIRIDERRMAITPSGSEYLSLKPEEVSIVDLESGSYEGRKPSSEKGLHSAVYKSRSEINCVVHTHSVNASVVAAARREVPPVLDDLAQIAGPTVRVADYALPSTGKLVRKTIKALRGRNAALLANHGAVCLGRSGDEAIVCCEVLEKGCKAFIEAEFLGGAKGINRFEAALMHQIYLKKYSRQKKMTYIIAYDIGTTSTKTCLFRLDGEFRLVSTAGRGYSLDVDGSGGVEQDPDEWWSAMCSSTSEVLAAATAAEPGFSMHDVRGITFCSQMQGLVVTDPSGKPLRKAMSYMDNRAAAQKERGLSGGIKIAGMNAVRLLKSLRITGAVAASAKDPLWKYVWVKENEPELYGRMGWWFDVKDYIVMKCTGRPCMTADSAFATFLYDNRKGREGWSRELCSVFGVDPSHLPEVVPSDEPAGGLLPEAAGQLGLASGIPVFGGGGDASLLGIGAGCRDTGDTHIYIGTSGWVSTVTDRRVLDLDHFIASVTGAVPGFYNYFSEQETSGKCLEWVMEHLALDEIGVYLGKTLVTDSIESEYDNLLSYLGKVVSETEPGCGGVLFTPWLHGSRSPFEDPSARGMFFNIGLNTGKRMLVRSVIEGLAYNKRWMLECIETRVKTNEVIRFVGGGAESDVTCGILADILDRPVEPVCEAKNAGALGAAVLCAAGLGAAGSFRDACGAIPVRRRFEPSPAGRSLYDRNYEVFKGLYKANKKAFHLLNGVS